ncbi:hypothetical protein [Campylobacter concisus]|uniref:Putative membrane protein n=1 Tax=Campylobacter concisus TaxID=199 RepID=A0A0M4SBB3_9BACT|nr:hypothetical protein [Campylobacter concisus]ALF47510.1 putative membrane protein [Campylobacter concisus]
MKFLIRSFIFLSLLCSLAFSKNGDNGYYYVMRDYNLPSSFKPIDGKFLKGNNYFGLRSPETGYYFIYSFTISQDAYYFLGSRTPGFYVGYGHVYIGGNLRVGRFGQRGSIGDYERYVASDNTKDPLFNYYDFIVFNSKEVARCKLNQEFNTDTMQCVDPCPAGQLWNVKTNACVVDCTDEDNHKFFTSDYTCINCSSALTIDDIARCYCSGLGSSYNPGYAWDPNKPNIVQAHCKDERLITFKFDKSKENSNKDKDKEKEDPNKDKDKENPNKDKDKEDPSKDKDKDNTTPGGGGSSGGGSSGGTGGGSSGGNNGGSSGGTGGGSSGGNNQGNGGQGGGQGNNGNSENATPGNIDYGELEERTADLANTYKENINNLFEPIDGIKKSLNDTISKIKDGNLMSLKKGGIPNTCPLSFDIDMVFFSKKVVFDFCSILSPIASSLYVFFFVAFFLLFLFLIAKLFIFTFMGW